ncbi:hypothetical protein ACTWJ9_18865 [Streptomyces sp. GDS52]|uniref:Uncharacterized protein n=1 Tax=Streptomyces cathayae TaxID=3031124 RepID=A0ABY8K756_9ACTN|nr:hypothetical protein [Streptomyces sp. HUAS 5]WGD42353.1 hypothetical protein PYS65_20640 [Streptomyces sp. HUAS 5]
MTEQRGPGTDPGSEMRRRRAGIVSFVAGLVAALAFFAFFPGLPHVIDWGAILVSLAVGALARWACRAWMARSLEEKEKHSDQV